MTTWQSSIKPASHIDQQAVRGRWATLWSSQVMWILGRSGDTHGFDITIDIELLKWTLIAGSGLFIQPNLSFVLVVYAAVMMELLSEMILLSTCISLKTDGATLPRGTWMKRPVWRSSLYAAFFTGCSALFQLSCSWIYFHPLAPWKWLFIFLQRTSWKLRSWKEIFDFPWKEEDLIILTDIPSKR